MENLRPQHIYEALLMREIDPQSELAVMENDFEIVTDAKGHQVEQADYVIVVIRKNEHGWYLARKIVFGRTDLLPHRQLIYDEDGNLSTQSRYEGYKDYEGGVSFPSQIEIWRPKEEYDITLTMVKLELNKPLANDKFVLEQPPGAEVVHLGAPAGQAQANIVKGR
jgi:outer membrane lipoprotein-sorting protein